MRFKTLRDGFALTFSSVFLLSCCALSAPLWGAESPNGIVAKADMARGPEGTHSFHVSVEDVEETTSIRTTKYRIYSKGGVRTLIETVAPERLKGRKLLMHENDLWLYLPNVKRPTRVSFSQRLTGEVSNGDIARVLLSRDYDAVLLGSETIGGKDCFKLGLTAKTKEATYRTIHYWVEKSTYFPSRMEFFALSGKLLKIGEYSEVRQVLGKPRMSRLIIRDSVMPSRRSILNYSDYKMETLDDSFFNKESLGG